MKIAIITQPLDSNYGGLLQNYALQQVLKKMGHSPITFDQTGWMPPIIIKIKIALKSLLTIYNPFKSFVKKNISTTPKAKSLSDFKKFEKKHKPDAYIVGSDQVWRPKYNMFLDSCFLTFTDSKKKIAYAASFGTDEWEFDAKQTAAYSKAVHQFKAIGVREQSAITLCKDHWDIDVALVLDPTLLLTAEEYTPLLNESNKQNYVFTYILDSENWKKDIIKSVCAHKQVCEFAGMYDAEGQIHERISIERWLTNLKQSKFVVCDSFHGTVFSILMHRPFLVLGNSKRGSTRLLSILEIVGLKNCLVMENEPIDIVNLPSINWNDVDLRLSKFRSKSIEFLSEALM